jgi:hypothetical protein
MNSSVMIAREPMLMAALARVSELCTELCCNVCCIVMCFVVLCCAALCWTALCWIALYCAVLCCALSPFLQCIVSYCTLILFIMLYCIIHTVIYCDVFSLFSPLFYLIQL